MPEHAVVLQDTRPYKAAAPQILPFFLSLGNQRKAKEKHAERSQQPGALLIPAVPPCCQLQPPAALAALCAPRLESGCISQPPANWAQLRLLSIPIGGEKLSKVLKGTDLGQTNVLVLCSYRRGLGAKHRVQIQFKLRAKKPQGFPTRTQTDQMLSDQDRLLSTI